MTSILGKNNGRIPLVATSSLWIAGFQGLFGDPCGVETYAVSLNTALLLKGPEVVLIDAGASSVEGRVREVLIQFRQWAPGLMPIVMSHNLGEDNDYIEKLIRAGAKGYVRASATAEEFSVALENVREGSIWAPRKVLSRLVQAEVDVREAAGPAGASVVKFTPREDQVIRMLVGGQCNREIGVSLGIDPVTVKAHLGRIMRKAGVGNRVELTMFALNRSRPDVSRYKRTIQASEHRP
jgi:DNA-binding NarL/FixJ family response regulator